jgi:hypothetical protein
LEAVIEVLVVKGMLPKREILDELTELRRRNLALPLHKMNSA